MAELVRKLGIKPGDTVVLLDAPEAVAARLLAAAPAGVEWLTAVPAERVAMVMLWPAALEGLRVQLEKLQRAIIPDGAIWGVVAKKKYVGQPGLLVSWDALQAAALATDLVDNKIVSIDEKTYATRFVIRRERRAAYAPDRAEGLA